MKMCEEISNKLTKGQKITIVGFGEFGFIGATQTTFESVEPKRHYQYCPEYMIGADMIHKPRRKRTMYKKHFDYNSSVMIFDGWVDINVDKIQWDSLGDNLRQTKYTCFDNRYMADIQNALNIKPIVKINC